jgi:cystathionine beta-lyase/cystathionine gamma-synthase
MRKTKPPGPARRNLATLSARGVRAAAPDARSNRPASEPLYQTSVFEFASIEASEPALAGNSDGLAETRHEAGYAYARHGRPNEHSFAASVAALEGAEAGIATSTGSSALMCALLLATKPGDRVLCQRDAYGGSRVLCERDLSEWGRQCELIDAYEPSKVADGLARGARFVLVETLSNPLLRPVDVAALSWHCRSYGALLCVDNTLATPILQRPLASGADLVLHSATKFLGGHHDCAAGVLVGDKARIAKASALVARLGLNAAPLDAWLAARGLRTLHLRVERGEQNARVLVEKLRAHSAVAALHYPGWGAVLSFDVGTRVRAESLVQGCPELALTPSFGGVESSLSHAATSSHRGLSDLERAALGIGDGLLRLSLGIEDADDLWSELGRALGRL